MATTAQEATSKTSPQQDKTYNRQASHGYNHTGDGPMWSVVPFRHLQRQSPPSTCQETEVTPHCWVKMVGASGAANLLNSERNPTISPELTSQIPSVRQADTPPFTRGYYLGRDLRARPHPRWTCSASRKAPIRCTMGTTRPCHALVRQGDTKSCGARSGGIEPLTLQYMEAHIPPKALPTKLCCAQ